MASKEKNMLGKIGSSDFYDFQKIPVTKLLKTKPNPVKYPNYEKTDKGYLVSIDVRSEIEKMSEFRDLGLERATENEIGEKVNEFGLMEEDKKIDNLVFGFWGEDLLEKRFFSSSNYEKQKKVQRGFKKAHIDFYDRKAKKIIEAKSVKKKTFSRYRNDPSLVKKKYEAQVQFQLGLVTESKGAEIIIYNPMGRKFFVIPIERDAEFLKQINMACEVFKAGLDKGLAEIKSGELELVSRDELMELTLDYAKYRTLYRQGGGQHGRQVSAGHH